MERPPPTEFPQADTKWVFSLCRNYLHAVPLVLELADRYRIPDCLLGLFDKIQIAFMIDDHDGAFRVLLAYRRFFRLRDLEFSRLG